MDYVDISDAFRVSASMTVEVEEVIGHVQNTIEEFMF